MSEDIFNSKIIKYLSFFFSIIILVACSDRSDREATRIMETATEINTPQNRIKPIPEFPGFVTGLSSEDDEYILASDRICLEMEQKPFWEIGDRWDVIDDLPPVEIKIDEQIVSVVSREMSTFLIIEFDKNGEEIGYHSRNMIFCIKPQLKTGIHLFNIKLTSTSKIEYNYSWEFIIK